MFTFGPFRLVSPERIGGKDTVGDGFSYDRPEVGGQLLYGAETETAVCSQMKVEAVDEGTV